MSDPERTPVGLTRLVQAVRVPPAEHLLGVGLFFGRHTIGASVARGAGWASTAGREAVAATVEAARNQLPAAVALAVTDGGVHVIEAGLDGQHLGPEVTYWPNGAFRVLVRNGWPLMRLSISASSGAAELECKTFFVGPNRHNRRVVRLVQEAAGIPTSHRR